MPIRKWWERVVTTWKPFRPARRRRSSARFSVETFEPRRMLSAFFVNSLADSHDATPGDGIAADVNGFTTLRAALEEANASIGADTITLPAGTITLTATNGPLTVTDNVTILGNDASKIDGTAFNEAFSVHGAARLQLDQVSVFSSGTLAASLRPTLLTANARQADLVVAFSAMPSTPFAVDTKSSSGLSSLIGLTTPEIVFDELTDFPAEQKSALDDSAVPTPDQAIDQIINALFRNEPDFILPVSGEQGPRPISESDLAPTPKGPSDKPMPAELPASNDSEDDVSSILRQWQREAGWDDFDFLTRASQPAITVSRQVGHMAVMAGMILSSVTATVWSPLERRVRSWAAWKNRRIVGH